jgi:hypothetical protein
LVIYVQGIEANWRIILRWILRIFMSMGVGWTRFRDFSSGRFNIGEIETSGPGTEACCRLTVAEKLNSET